MADKHNLLTRNHLNCSGKLVLSTLIFHTNMLQTQVFLWSIFLLQHMPVPILSAAAHPRRLAGLDSSHRFQGDAGLSTPVVVVLQPVCPTREENKRTTSVLEETAASPLPSRNTGSVTPFEMVCRLHSHEWW